MCPSYKLQNFVIGINEIAMNVIPTNVIVIMGLFLKVVVFPYHGFDYYQWHSTAVIAVIVVTLKVFPFLFCVFIYFFLKLFFFCFSLRVSETVHHCAKLRIFFGSQKVDKKNQKYEKNTYIQNQRCCC